jgi:hypothetical protein
MSVDSYTRDLTMTHACVEHETSYGCQQRPWACRSACGTIITRNQQHRRTGHKTECVVCIYSQYEDTNSHA